VTATLYFSVITLELPEKTAELIAEQIAHAQ
jgi:hypothetical protein